MATVTFETAAAKGFEVLWPYFTSSTFTNNFWFAGNTFHTCLDYLINARLPDTNGVVVTSGRNVYQSLVAGDWWRDDYGWWGDAFVRAIENRSALGLSASQYDDLFAEIASAASYCWRRMNNTWSDALYGVPADHAAGTANIGGGVYNIPGMSCTEIMQGRNSVSNEGYWLVSLGLARNLSSPAYAQAANAMGTWTQQWLARTPVCPNGNGLIGLLDDACHVLERPMGNAALASWYWTGDQGLLSRALVEANTQPARAMQIVNAAIASLQDDEGILHENLGFYEVPSLSGFLADYATGKGIFMRSLRVVNTAGSLNKFIVQNATAVWCHRHEDTGMFTFNWDRKDGYEPIDLHSKGYPLDLVITQAAGLDALNAALLVVPPDTPISCS